MPSNVVSFHQKRGESRNCLEECVILDDLMNYDVK